MAELVRVNTNITKDLNDWLNERSKKTGFSKSTLIHLALDNYRNHVELINDLPGLTRIMADLQYLADKKSLEKRMASGTSTERSEP